MQKKTISMLSIFMILFMTNNDYNYEVFNEYTFANLTITQLESGQ